MLRIIASIFLPDRLSLQTGQGETLEMFDTCSSVFSGRCDERPGRGPLHRVHVRCRPLPVVEKLLKNRI